MSQLKMMETLQRKKETGEVKCATRAFPKFPSPTFS